MQDAWRAYLELALGLTEAPRKRAQDAARRLAGTGGATAVQLQALAEELFATGVANREALTKLVRFEVDRALGAVGLATADEVAELTRRVHDLERQLREAKGAPGGLPAGDAAPDTTVPRSGGAATRPAPATEADAAAAGTARPPTGTVAKKTVAKTVAKKAVTPTTVATTAPKAVAKKAVAKKAVAKRAGSTADAAPPAAGSTGPGGDAARPGKVTPGHDGSGGAG
ncbi:phasin family protein [Micromonospora sp. SCSIO 07396]